MGIISKWIKGDEGSVHTVKKKTYRCKSCEYESDGLGYVHREQLCDTCFCHQIHKAIDPELTRLTPTPHHGFDDWLRLIADGFLRQQKELDGLREQIKQMKLNS